MTSPWPATRPDRVRAWVAVRVWAATFLVATQRSGWLALLILWIAADFVVWAVQKRVTG